MKGARLLSGKWLSPNWKACCLGVFYTNTLRNKGLLVHQPMTVLQVFGSFLFHPCKFSEKVSVSSFWSIRLPSYSFVQKPEFKENKKNNYD